MDTRESRHLFEEADRLYRAGQYAEALRVLDRLDEAFPDTRNILVPKAMCLVHLGDVPQADAIYASLAARYPEERLQKLRKLLERAAPPEPAPVDALDAVLNVCAAGLENARITATPESLRRGRQADGAVAAVPPQEGAGWGRWVAIGVAVVVVLGFLSLPLFVESDGTQPAGDRPEMTLITDATLAELPRSELTRFLLVFAVVALPISLVSLALSIFLTLLFFGELPRETFLENAVVLLAYSLFILVITGVSWVILSFFFGTASGLGVLVGFLYAVHATFELGFVRTIIFFVIFVVMTLIESPIVAAILRLFYFDVPVTFFFT